MRGTATKESIDAMIRECRDMVHALGREAIFDALSCGEWTMPIGCRLVSVKAIDAWDIMRRCAGLTDDEVGEYLAYVIAVLCLALVDRKGKAFFDTPGASSFTMMLCVRPFAEIRASFEEAIASEETEP